MWCTQRLHMCRLCTYTVHLDLLLESLKRVSIDEKDHTHCKHDAWAAVVRVCPVPVESEHITLDTTQL